MKFNMEDPDNILGGIRLKDKNLVKSVIKAMRIMETLIHKGSPLSISKISNKTGINISTVHRIINTLVKLGYVEQNQEGHYQLGLHTYELADIINEDFNIKKLARPYMEEIVESCNETCNLVILENNEVVYVDQVESNNMVRMFARPGSRGPAYCTGSGKALLAFQDYEEIDDYLSEKRLKPYTENTITNPEKLKEELLEIRKRGYALDLEEMEKGVRCIAAPIIGRDEKLLGAISVSGPSTRISLDYLNKQLVPLVKGKAEELSSKLKNGGNSI